MKNYIVYLDSGEIIKTGQCQDSDLHLQGINVIEGIADDSTQYIDNGQIVNMQPKPDGTAYFDYETKNWVQDIPAQEALIKNQRNILLSESDWTQLIDVQIQTKQAWATYRKALRDITTQEGYPFNVIWPTKPN